MGAQFHAHVRFLFFSFSSAGTYDRTTTTMTHSQALDHLDLEKAKKAIIDPSPLTSGVLYDAIFSPSQPKRESYAVAAILALREHTQCMHPHCQHST